MIKAILPLLLVMVLTQGTVTQQEEESDLQINWNGFYRCLMEVGPFAQEVRNLINLIKAGKYTEAFQLAMNLFNSGSQIIKRCFQFIKSSEINLQIDRLGFARCIIQNMSIPSIMPRIIIYVNTGNIIQLINLLTDYLKNHPVPNQCKRFY